MYVAQLYLYVGFCEPQHHRTCCIYGISYGGVALEVVSRDNLIMTFHIFNNYVLDTLYVSTTSTIVNLLVKTVYQTQFALMAKQPSNVCLSTAILSYTS